jgi:serine/threonine-protein kinase GIN4
VTLFEILVGRTPFEHGEAEQFITTEDLKRYWLRTVRSPGPCRVRPLTRLPVQIQGKWVGGWNMSAGAERLLSRLLTPNADLRCTAADALADAYWTAPVAPLSPPSLGKTPRREPAPRAPSVAEILSPWATRSMRGRGKENAAPRERTIAPAASAPGLDAEKRRQSRQPLKGDDGPLRARTGGSRSVAAASQSKPELRKRANISATQLSEASKENASRPASVMLAPPSPSKRQSAAAAAASSSKRHSVAAPASVLQPKQLVFTPKPAVGAKPARPAKAGAKVDKENVPAPGTPGTERTPQSRKPFGPRTFGSPSHSPVQQAAAPVPAPAPAGYFDAKRVPVPIVPVGAGEDTSAFRAALRDRTRAANVPTPDAADAPSPEAAKVPAEDGEPQTLSGTVGESVVRRMRDWERERARMRAMLDEPSPVDGAAPLAPVTPARTVSMPVKRSTGPSPSSTLVATVKTSTTARSGSASVLGKRRGSEDEENTPRTSSCFRWPQRS